MSDPIIIAIALAVFAPLYAVTTWINVKGAQGWADATAAVHRARSHGYEADATQETVTQAADALDDLNERRAFRPPPSEEELLDFVRAEREQEYTTDKNAGIAEPEGDGMNGVYKAAAQL